MDYAKRMQNKYRLSFTFGGLLIPESAEIAASFLQSYDWEKVRKQVMNNDILRKTRESSRYRYFREIRDRLKQAYQWEIELTAEAGLETRRSVLFLVVCRYYQYIDDFYKEVIRPKLLQNDFILMDYEYPVFFESKAAAHPKLTDLKDTTKKKIQTVIIRILREAGIVVQRKNEIFLQRPYVPEEMKGPYIENGHEEELRKLLL